MTRLGGAARFGPMKLSVLLVCLLFTGLVAFSISPPEAAAKRAPVLGLKGHKGPNGRGWGMVRPHRIYNGGVPNGLMSSIRWRGWGKRVAKGKGLGNQYMPGGGYYSRPVKVRLRAKWLGRCYRGGPRAYTRLIVQMQEWPGGPFGRWFRWSGDRSTCTRF